MSELWLRAEALGGEIKRLRAEAREAGDHELHGVLKELDRRSTLGDPEAGYAAALEAVRSRLVPEVAEAIRPNIRREIVLQHKATSIRLDQRETELDQREQELDHRPKSRTPWIAAGAIPAVVLTTIIHALV